MIFQESKPNDAHKGLAYLESIGKLDCVITQNIDSLHQKGGSKTVYELHGSIYHNHCIRCHQTYHLTDIINATGIPLCKKCQGIIKPDVVLYEESLDHNIIQNAVEAISKADLLIIGGTSLQVYPAAGFLNYYRGKNLVLMNKTATSADNQATLIFRNNISQIFKELLHLYQSNA